MLNRRKKITQVIACFVAVNIVTQAVAPTVALALTSGPSQPESSSFEPSGTTQMVDLFSGDFTYNIPLFELPGPDGGYPFNLAYHSGIGMDQEASWVGLGWNINPGAINRQVRGLPDEFKGDQITVQQDMNPMHNFGINAGGGIELFGGDPLKGSLDLNASLYYNNYRGFGFGTGATMGLSSADDKNAVSGGVGLSFDTQNGVGGKLSLGYEQANASLGFNSESGASAGFSMTLFNDIKQTDEGKEYTSEKTVGGSMLGSATRSYSPSVGMEYQTIPLSVSFKTGAGVGVFGNAYVGGFYTVQKLKETNYSKKAYGYFYLEDDSRDDKSLLDFNREKQGLIHEKTPNLAIPNLTADYYSFSGQGTGGMFRAWRSDYGSVYEPYAKSNINGGSIGVDLGAPHFGLAGSYQHGNSKSGKWNDKNDLKNYFEFSNDKSGYYEPAYFKLYGEHSPGNENMVDAIGGTKAIRPVVQALSGGYNGYKATTSIVDEGGNIVSNVPNSVGIVQGNRVIRGQSIQQIQNEWLLDNNSQELLPEFKINHYNGIPDGFAQASNTLQRTGENYKPHHFAGMTVVNKNGQRYVYGLPAINSRKVEAAFSVGDGANDCKATTTISQNGTLPDYEVDGTDKFLQYTETPAYAHSYLLTSILGQDYVDVNNNGPDEADYGYWVKFTYTKAYSNYKWRFPYTDAGFNVGVKTKYSDNKGNYSYGEKEVWYVARAETKSHVAVFELNDTRTDGLEAAGEFASAYSKGSNGMYKLDEIKLYTRSEFNKGESTGIPIQTVVFKYNNSLCPGIENGSSGKLTLENVGFYYQNNKRGLLNKYEFEYSTSNFSYNKQAYDRWGNYAPVGSDVCANTDMPYVRQFDHSVEQSESAKNSYQAIKDANASAWHLTKITTPTGSDIIIDYESDDYGYVQHRKATQMFYMDKLELGSGLVYDNSGSPTGNQTRVYFKLEDPIPISESNPEEVMYDRYLKGLERRYGNSTYVQLYFKNYVNLRDGVWEYVNGYANLKSNGYGVDLTRTSSIDVGGDGVSTGVNCYTYGYVELEAYHDSNHNRDYHPFAALGWQKMRADHPDLLLAGGKIDVDDGSRDYDKAMKVKSLINAIPQISKMFKGYLKYCYDKGWASQIDLNKSVLRLCSPDQRKFGGGVRVKQITTTDNFAVDGVESSYGQVFDYTTTNENGETISSGVASYEPLIGGEENPLRYAKTFTDDQGFQSDNQLYFEYPINESYYPSPSVGYSKVTVRSLATESVLRGTKSDEIGITGETVNEYYTAKDFPTTASETEIQKQKFHMWIPVPLIGLINTDKLAASQGYAIEVNDMHGKQKAITYYGASEGIILRDFPVSKVQYNYQSSKSSYEGVVINRLYNSTNEAIIQSYDSGKYELGVDYEMFVDHLSSSSYNVTGGIDGNLEMMALLPLPEIWPSYSQGKTALNTMVINKVIHRSGLLKEVIATDGQSTVTTSNLRYDPYSGEPFVTKTTNQFGDNVYQLTGYSNKPFQEFPKGSLNPAGSYPSSRLGTAAKVLGGEFDKNYSFLPGFMSFGALRNSLSFRSLDTLESSWDNPEFFRFIKEDYTGYYFSDQIVNYDFANQFVPVSSNGLEPGAELCLKSENGGVYWGRVVQVGRDSIVSGDHLEDMQYTIRPIMAIYSHNALPVSGSFTSFVLKPGEENVIGMKTYEMTSLTMPFVQSGLDELVEIEGIGSINSNYIEDVISTSPYVTYGSSKGYRDAKSSDPYASGEAGVLRIGREYNYTPNRKSSGDLSEDGVYLSNSGAGRFHPLTEVKQYSGGFNTFDNLISGHVYWTLGQTFTAYDPYGHNTEVRNSLGVYSSAGYAHYGTSMSWRANNAKEDEVFFISFEDSEYQLKDLLDVTSSPYADGHTGKKCLQVTTDSEYKIDIKPEQGKKYFLSAWVKSDEETFNYSANADANTRGIEVKFYDKDYSISRGTGGLLKPKGPIVEGWQKVEGTFLVSSSTSDPVESVSIDVKSGEVNGIQATLFVDDLRIMPHEANMTSYVYDPGTYKLKATLDENNFASLYYYDEEGKLFLVKKETEKGIYTIQETRSYQ